MTFTSDTQKRLRSWLENKLNEGDCVGLVWKNKDEGIFNFPWFRFKDIAKEMRPQAFKVFVDWAMFTNNMKFKGAEPDYPKLKHNMRCALNKLKGDFEKLHDNTHIKEEPHIVYRFNNSTGSSQISSPSSEYGNNFDSNEDKFYDKNIPQVVHSLSPEYKSEQGSQFSNIQPVIYVAGPNGSQEIPQTYYPDFLSSPHAEYYPDQDQCLPVFAAEYAYAVSSPMSASYNDVGHEDHAQPSLPSDLEALNSMDLIGLETSAALPMSGVSSLNTPNTSLELDALIQPVASGTGPKEDLNLNVKVSYGQPFVTMMNETVGENGCRLYFGNRLLAETKFDQDLYGPRELTDIMLPIVEQCSTVISEQYMQVITDILKQTDRGFTLTFKDGDIYVQRLCRSRVYLCDANFNSTCLDRKSKTPEKAFDFHNFCSKLDDCKKFPDKQIKLPPSHFYLTIGIEANPAHKNGPFSKVPILICVTHLTADKMYNQAQAWKRELGDSMQPAYSGLDSCDQLLEMYKGLTINPLDK